MKPLLPVSVCSGTDVLEAKSPGKVIFLYWLKPSIVGLDIIAFQGLVIPKSSKSQACGGLVMSLGRGVIPYEYVSGQPPKKAKQLIQG